MPQKYFWLLLLLLGCKKEKETAETETVFLDQGVSRFADTDPTNDVLLQAFWWDSFSDTKIANYNSYYHFLEDQIVPLSNAHIDLLWFPPSSEGEGMGYHPRKLFDFNSQHGSTEELTSVGAFAIASNARHGRSGSQSSRGHRYLD